MSLRKPRLPALAQAGEAAPRFVCVVRLVLKTLFGALGTTEPHHGGATSDTALHRSNPGASGRPGRFDPEKSQDRECGHDEESRPHEAGTAANHQSAPQPGSEDLTDGHGPGRPKIHQASSGEYRQRSEIAGGVHHLVWRLPGSDWSAKTRKASAQRTSPTPRAKNPVLESQAETKHMGNKPSLRCPADHHGKPIWAGDQVAHR